MNIGRTPKSIYAIGLSIILIASSGLTAYADESQISCSTEDVTQGLCVTAVVSGNEDPVVAGVTQAIKSGTSLEAVKKFVERRGAQKSDVSQEKISALVETASNMNSPERAALDVQPFNANGVGTVVGKNLTVHDTVTYLYCNSAGCSAVGRVVVDFQMSISGNLSFVLSGDLDVPAGNPAVTFVDVTCQTLWDGPLNIDQVVKSWGNCDNAETTYPAPSGVTIHAASWSGGGLGEVYHPYYGLTFKIANGNQFHFGWDGREYKVESNGITNWR